MSNSKIRKIFRNKEVYFHIVFWVFYFATINAVWTNNWFDRSLRPGTVSQFAILLFPIFFYFNAFRLIPKYLKKRKWFHYIIITVIIIILIECFRILIHIIITGIDTSFYLVFIKEFNSYDNIILGRLNPIFLCLQFSFAYRFTRDWILNNTLIDKLKAEKTEMELAFLKSQVNPHFLFNNLNTLDDLIDRNPRQAKEYLHKLSNMYRYILTTSEKDVVSLCEEWNFIDDYIYLLKERYGVSYQFIKKNTSIHLKDYLIPPATLQSLIENAVKHNQGSIKNPLIITIEIDKNKISVSHKKNLKMDITHSLGTGLKNLTSRYQLLSSKEVSIINADMFTVTLPLIKNLS
ncbi:sensor histidine kinase [uncultured Aquimarina sp.]|uniref:sensor histidine kinase n=1 Tax=uncultured Aquimarina sp. TaxID=575652 RepID=UPI002633A45F|nr:sensor histidine kinase [uncultured Aquimarina sp.]